MATITELRKYARKENMPKAHIISGHFGDKARCLVFTRDKRARWKSLKSIKVGEEGCLFLDEDIAWQCLELARMMNHESNKATLTFITPLNQERSLSWAKQPVEKIIIKGDNKQPA